jgi:prepilin-type N-terminal cleavage/methylation domain-containing protein
MRERAFSLFEVLIALGVFAIAVTGLAIGLQSAVEAAINARERSLSRFVIESRLAAAMSDPPLDGKREIDGSTNNGVSVLETFEPIELMNTNGQILPGMWKLRVSAKSRRSDVEETAEILIYRP